MSNEKLKEIKNPVLRTWVALNEAMKDADEEVCNKLLKEETKGRARKQFLKRIHSRLNKVRADRERAELENQHGES